MAFARVYFHCHWVGDTAAGTLVGVVAPVILHELAGNGFRSYEAAHALAGFVIYGGYMSFVSGGHLNPIKASLRATGAK